MSEASRKVLYVVGAGRSGTSTLAGIVSLLGMHVPQPEVVADDSNPKGFGEPRWVVDAHDRWLREARVQVSDARPGAWRETGEICARPRARERVAEWLGPHFDVHPELVVKDPRLSWFLDLWRTAAERNDATPVFATMLRPPAEVVASRQKYYASRLGPAHLAAGWVNMLLHTEHATRGSAAEGRRVFVRYEDLLGDWQPVVTTMAARLDLRTIADARPDRVAEVRRFVDPDLRRMSLGLDDLGLPRRLHELTAETWEQLDRVARDDGDTPEAHTTFDQLRAAYVELYEEAEAISRSSQVAAQVVAREEARAAAAPVAPAPEPPRHSWADRVPHGVRARVPAPVRRGVRRLLQRRR